MNSTNLVPIRIRRATDDPFFVDATRTQGDKHTIWNDNLYHNLSDNTTSEFACLLNGCNKKFLSLDKYRIHYNTVHVNVCFYCKRSFPTSHLLEIHMVEVHDNFFRTLAEKQNMYRCFIRACDEKFPDKIERKNHFINAHQFPANFIFAQLVEKGESSLKPTASPSSSETATTTMQARCRIPKDICFGHGVTKGFRILPGKHVRK